MFAWDLCTTIYSATREHNGPGEHYCEGFIFKRMSYSTVERATEAESVRQEEAVRAFPNTLS